MKYRFSDFEIDLALHELRRKGASVHIEPQVFDLIVHLVRNHDRVVSKDELIDTIWNGRAISEAAFSSRINGARRVLGDNGTDQLYIRTLQRRGFRFVGDVQAVGALEGDPQRGRNWRGGNRESESDGHPVGTFHASALEPGDGTGSCFRYPRPGIRRHDQPGARRAVLRSFRPHFRRVADSSRLR